MHQPLSLVMEIMDLRAYARAKAALDQAGEREAEVPLTSYVTEVWRNRGEVRGMAGSGDDMEQSLADASRVIGG